MLTRSPQGYTTTLIRIWKRFLHIVFVVDLKNTDTCDFLGFLIFHPDTFECLQSMLLDPFASEASYAH